ncbi:MAG: Na+/H+ antiporter NhaA [Myxococcales bacterium]|nr:Na+/H+ antiporter NhaA [Myxococcales bacterium]
MIDDRDPRSRPVPRVLFALVRPFQRFFRTEVAGGIALFVSTLIALVWANSAYRHGYHHLFETEVAFGFGALQTSHPLHHWINDGLMTLFFFIAGMEIKRELVKGELRTFSKALLPALAALGGMLAPAAIYWLIAGRGDAHRGWGIPMATDIAFALGCLAAVRRRVPPSLVIFLTALAIFDDLGAIVVIAVFYGQSIQVGALAAAAGLTGLLAVFARARVQRATPYTVVGFFLWLALLRSGLHATLAGVILGLAIPAVPRRSTGEVLDELDASFEVLRRETRAAGGDNETLALIERHLESVQAPLDRFVHGLHGVVAFGVVPLFALANAGVTLVGHPVSLSRGATLGAMLGLALGKPIGVFGATWLAVRSGLAERPSGARWRDIFGVSVMAGVGFTMSLFVDQLAFAGQPALIDDAKLGVLVGSLVSAVSGVAWIIAAGRERAQTASEQDIAVVADLRRFAPGYRVESWVAQGPLVGKTLGEAQLRNEFGLTVIGCWSRDDHPSLGHHRRLLPMGAENIIRAGDTLLIVGEDAKVDAFQQSLSGPTSQG